MDFTSVVKWHVHLYALGLFVVGPLLTPVWHSHLFCADQFSDSFMDFFSFLKQPLRGPRLSLTSWPVRVCCFLLRKISSSLKTREKNRVECGRRIASGHSTFRYINYKKIRPRLVKEQPLFFLYNLEGPRLQFSLDFMNNQTNSWLLSPHCQRAQTQGYTIRLSK